jgi:cell pole-organizing protein PopZ
MPQASSAQREPSMEEILASIRRIIEDNDAGRAPEKETVSKAPSAERTVIEVDAFRGELRAPAPEVAPVSRETPVKKPTLADIQAQIAAEAAAMPSRWAEPAPAKQASAEAPIAQIPALERAAERPTYDRSPDDIRRAIENSRQAREDARALLGIPEPANTARPPQESKSEPTRLIESLDDRHEAGDRHDAGDRHMAVAESHYTPVESAAKPALLSERVERQVTASFSELSEAFAARSRKTFDEMAEEMIEPLLRDWMENNLPTLVERLVREEIERVARGAQ